MYSKNTRLKDRGSRGVKPIYGRRAPCNIYVVMSSYVKDGMSVGSSHNLFVFNQITHGKESHFLPTKGHGQEVKAAKGQISIIFQDHSF